MCYQKERNNSYIYNCFSSILIGTSSSIFLGKTNSSLSFCLKVPTVTLEERIKFKKIFLFYIKLTIYVIK